jgi:ISXO2-like transposase domain
MPSSAREYPCNGRGTLGYTPEKEFVKGDVHTNSLENVWSRLKRSIIGSYQQVSAKHTCPAMLCASRWCLTTCLTSG